MDLRRWMVVALCAALGAGAAVVAASCGDDDNGRVEVEGGTTGTGTAPPAPAPPAPAPPGPRPTGEGGRLHRGLGRPRLERVQRGQAVLDRLPGDGAGGDRGAPARVRGRRRVRGRPLAVLVPAARQGAAVAGRRGVGAPARALARAGRPARGAGGLRLLHRLLLGHALLPPAHRRAVDELRPLLAAGGHQLRPHERQRARAGAEVGDGAERGHAAGGGADGRAASPRIAAAALLAAALGALAWRRFERERMPAYPPRREPAARPATRSPAACT